MGNLLGALDECLASNAVIYCATFSFSDGTCSLNVCFPTLSRYQRHHLDRRQETRAYYCLLRHLLTEEVQRNFKEERRPLTRSMSDLMRRLEDASEKRNNKKDCSEADQS